MNGREQQYYPTDEIAGASTQEAGEVVLDVGDASVRVRLRLRLERGFADQELVAEHTQ